MFAHPDWSEIDMFDSDDLLDDGIYVLISNPSDNNSTRFAYVWIGNDVEDVDDVKALELARDCLAAMSLEGYDHIDVVEQQKEPQRFWSLFING